MKKRVLAIAMSLAMTLSLLPASALATETGETPEEETPQSISTNELSEPAENTDITVDVYFDPDVTVVVGSSSSGNNASTVSEAIKGGATDIALGGDVTEDVTIPEGRTVTIDLAGHKLTNSSGHTITNNGVLTIKDSIGNGTVDNVTHAKAAVFNAAGGTVTLNGGNYTRSREANNSASSSGGNSFYTIQNYGDMTLNEGITVSQGANGRGQFSSLIENGYYDGSGKSQNATMTINGGTFIGGLNTVKNDDWGILTVNGGNFTNYAQYAFFNANIATINGGTFVNEGTRGAIYSFAHWNDNYGIGKLTITGGTFKNNGTSIIEVTAADADVSITGGTYSSNVSKYVPENYECVKNEDNTYTVREMEAKLVVKPERDESGNISATLEGNYSSSGTQIDKPETGAGSGTPESVGRSVEINLMTDGQTEPATGGSTTLKITQATANSLADASSLKVTTNEGTVELDNDALEKVGKASGTVSITVTKNSTASENNVAASYTVEVKSGNTDLLPDGGSGNGTITLTLPVPAESKDTTLYVWYAVEQGSSVMYVDRVGTYNANSGAVVTFDVSHLSRYDLLSSEPNANETAVASITRNGQTTYYDSLQAAVDAVTDNTQTTIKLLKTMEGNGVKVEATKNIIFDLNEKTYTINTKTVGSTGTETNGFQLLKGNTITIKNGTLKPGNSAQILLQNYSNLTLDNVTVDCRGATQCQYAMSNNFGNVVVTGNTNIYAAEGQVAFDLWYGMSSTYYDGVTVTFDENMTGTVKGKVEYGASSNQTEWMKKTNLKIENGNFIISFASTGSHISDISKANIDVSGGNFSQPVEENYLDDSLTAQLYSTRKNSEAPYSYYASVEAAINASQPGDTVTALNATTTDTCKVTINYGYGSNSIIQVASDTKISLPAPGTRAGYTFNGWRSSADNNLHKAGTSVTITADTTFTANWTRNQTDRPSGGGSSSSDSGDYLISVDRVSGGRVTVQPGRADKGDTVTITVYPNDGYELDELVVTDSRGNEIDLDARSATRFTFTMPGGKVTVEASFVREGGQPQVPQTTFADVPASAWYYNAVEYVYENGLMSGVSGGRFAPDDTLTRAMLVQTLYAMEGRPAAASAGFADVASGDWYASAVNWAAANGVVSGVSETGFGPNNALTREQLALILYRFAQYKGYDVTGTSDLAAYADGSSVSGWAAEAMGWAVDAGLISGVGGNQIAPTGTASRAQVAQILMNFCENVAR